MDPGCKWNINETDKPECADQTRFDMWMVAAIQPAWYSTHLFVDCPVFDSSIRG